MTFRFCRKLFPCPHNSLRDGFKLITETDELRVIFTEKSIQATLIMNIIGGLDKWRKLENIRPVF